MGTDGLVTATEAGGRAELVTSGYEWVIAYDPATGKELWRTKGVAKYAKGTAYVPSPILYDGHVYLVTDRGLITCLDARTGEVKYEGARVPVPATFTASPVAWDGRLLLISEDGDGFLIKAGSVPEVLRTNSLGEAVYASPAVAGGRLFIRGVQHLYCIGRRPA